MSEKHTGLEALRAFYQGKRVLLTGHTGFKGSWLSLLLRELGAQVHGYALEPPTQPSLAVLLGQSEWMDSELGDIRDFAQLRRCFERVQPELVFHLAAQPLVRASYREPRETYETNVMGTVNVLECLRLQPGVRSFLNVTTDKVYENREEAGHAFTEDEKLDGFDPYSNSKSCSELVSHSYQKAFFAAQDSCRISTARAGNVIGGGDFAQDRIVPDCVRASVAGKVIELRNPNSVRPYQHVLEPLYAYLLLAMRQWEEPGLAGSYNVGPEESDCVTTGELASRFVSVWGDGASWQSRAELNAPHEASFLRLDSARLRQALDWKPCWTAQTAIERTVAWYKAWHEGQDMLAFSAAQIQGFFENI